MLHQPSGNRMRGGLVAGLHLHDDGLALGLDDDLVGHPCRVAEPALPTLFGESRRIPAYPPRRTGGATFSR
jgi:hypothetical protein